MSLKIVQVVARPRRGACGPALVALIVSPLLLTATAGAAVVITPTQQTRTISASATSTSVSIPRSGCSSNATDSDQADNAAPGAGLFEQQVAAAATTPCTNASGDASQESNTLVSSLIAKGDASAHAFGFAIGSSAFGEAESVFDVAFTTSNGGPFEIEGLIAADGLGPAGSQATVTLKTAGGTILYSETVNSSIVGGEFKVLSWSDNLAAGSYRLTVNAKAQAPSGDGSPGASSNFDVRLVACDPWCEPPNNECAAAINVGEGTHPFSNINATDSGPYPACSFAQDSEIRSDIWYRVTADCTGDMTVATCGGTSLDTKIGVYQGGVCPANPANLVMLGCNDDACSFQSSVTVPMVVGQQFLVRIGGYRGEQGTGTFAVSFACDVPNDICSGAEPIGLGSHAFSTINATSGMPDVTGCGPGQPKIAIDIWFDFLSPCTGPVEVSTCNSVNYDSKIAVYATCPDAGDPPLACSDDAPGCGLSSKLTFAAVGGQTYRVRVGGFQPTVGTPTSGSGTITLTCNGLLGDLNGDGHVNGADVGILLAAWGNSDAGDLNGDGVTNGADLGIMLGAWTG